MSVTTDGTGPDTVTTSTEVYDAAGVAHTVTMRYERQSDLTWNLYAEIPEGTGTVALGGADNPITGLTFSDGSPTGLGSVDNNIRIQFNAPSQDIETDFGSDGDVEGVTQFGSDGTAFVFDQNGFGDGELANLFVSTTGTIEGFYSNGQTRQLGQLGIVTFQNDGACARPVTTSSRRRPTRARRASAPGTSGAQAPSSPAPSRTPTWTPRQFVRLIEAQRGYQANARRVGPGRGPRGDRQPDLIHRLVCRAGALPSVRGPGRRRRGIHGVRTRGTRQRSGCGQVHHDRRRQGRQHPPQAQPRQRDGLVVDSSEGRDPLPYLHGAGNIVAGLEAALVGKSGEPPRRRGRASRRPWRAPRRGCPERAACAFPPEAELRRPSVPGHRP